MNEMCCPSLGVLVSLPVEQVSFPVVLSSLPVVLVSLLVEPAEGEDVFGFIFVL